MDGSDLKKINEYMSRKYAGMSGYASGIDEEQLRAEELEEAETLIRNGADTRQIARKQFQTLGQSDLFKLYRKYGMTPGNSDTIGW
ncbi:MAG: hypothetical protein HUJ76_07200 [Parasporobacterium sp.]|nr:hypothetical protein [Parasporobacterium sp.]